MVLDQPRTSPSVRSLWLAALALLVLAPLLYWNWVTTEAQLTLTPDLSHPSGFYADGFRLTLTAQRGATIYYTLNGERPTASAGELYRDSIWINNDAGVVVLRAIAVDPTGTAGSEITASYFVGIDSNLPLISLSTDPANLHDPTTGIYANPFQKGSDWERVAHLTYVDTDRISTLDTDLGIRIHGGVTRRYDKKSFRLYFRDEYGQSWLNYQLFSDSRTDRFKRLVLHSGGQDALEEYRDWSLLRNQLVSEIAFEVGGFATRSRPVLLFINGDPWGIYLMRERIDETFLETNYAISDSQILDTPEMNERGEEADQAEWDEFMRFVEANDLADAENYRIIQEQIDIANYIDYNIIQMYSGNIDWPHRNVNLFLDRSDGHWRWIFWDNDSAFALNQVSKLDENMIEFATRPEVEGTTLLAKLMQNEEFRLRFSQRADFLLSTTLSPERVSAHIDRLAADIEPNLIHESGRWGNGANWHISIDELHEFAEKRPGIMRTQLGNYFSQLPE